jgi:hypothetical protein
MSTRCLKGSDFLPWRILGVSWRSILTRILTPREAKNPWNIPSVGADLRSGEGKDLVKAPQNFLHKSLDKRALTIYR